MSDQIKYNGKYNPLLEQEHRKTGRIKYFYHPMDIVSGYITDTQVGGNMLH
jgi:hypothetical protein